ncbi:conserved hypothetical protein [Burkholderia latens]|uniref:hypothetical protein n=1 Tax=Burkholderia latens TaxID=488446 RepID=UPI0039A5AC67
MTWSKYRRLCLVVVVPFLIVGWLCTLAVWPFEKYVTIDCSADNYCRPISEKQYYSNDHLNQTFQVDPASRRSNSYIHPFARATPRIVRGAVIDNADYYSGASAEVQAFVKTFKGAPATLLLGGKQENFLTVQQDGTLLMNCHTLEFSENAGTYNASCFGPGWGSPLSFSVEGRDREMLDGLGASVEKVVNERRTEYRWFQIVMYPIFFYGFLVLSLLCWLVARATKFVKAG